MSTPTTNKPSPPTDRPAGAEPRDQIERAAESFVQAHRNLYFGDAL